MSKPSLILASTSVYRKALLEKLTPHFQTAKPDVDETPLAGETPQQLVERLAVLKAKAIAAQQPNAVVIGSDQVAVFQNDILGKPHTVDKAIAQLSRFSGHTVTFLTGLAVVNSSTGQTQVLTDAFHVSFRELTLQEIQRYVEREMPLNCAGSFKSEGLGITLFSKLDGEDPNSLIGLPLIKLHQLLKNTGLDLLLEP
ncbi:MULTISPECIES: Maf family protein [Rheinheimera]|uniref:7-methyl-GTP pyrophosphatase n=1 Tax=Rheinheimera marina TaxID=1774958 RepID=A0ABV9JQI5_9GAMM